jgi:glycosyltransferase involved in cell wall biosynthesis
MIILQQGCQDAKRYGFNSAIQTLIKGLDCIKEYYTLDEAQEFSAIICNDFHNTEKAIELKKKTGKPLIASFHLSNPSFEIEKRLVENCDGIIVYSQLMVDFVKTYHPNTEVPVEMVALGVDTDFWCPDETPRNNHILLLGRSKSPNKNFVETMFRIVRDEVHYKVAGDIDYTTLDGNNLGYLNPVQLREQYRQATLHILPSTFEPFGMVTLEAMACGCPVAVSTKTGVAELLTSDTAILFDPDSDFSVKDFMQQAKTYDHSKIREFVKKYNHINHAKNFSLAVQNIIRISNNKRGNNP